MEILGIGPMELILILIVALMVFGPDRLPQIGAKLGRAMREMRKATRAISDEINATRSAIESPARELAEPFKDVTDAAKSAGAIAAAARNPGQAIRDSVMREYNKATEPASSTETSSENTIAPPAAADAATAPKPGPAQGEEPLLLSAPEQPVAELPAPEEPLAALPAPDETLALPSSDSSAESDEENQPPVDPGLPVSGPPEQ